MNRFVSIGVTLLALWAMLWPLFHVVSGFIHVIALITAVMIVWGLVKCGASAVERGP